MAGRRAVVKKAEYRLCIRSWLTWWLTASAACSLGDFGKTQPVCMSRHTAVGQEKAVAIIQLRGRLMKSRRL